MTKGRCFVLALTMLVSAMLLIPASGASAAQFFSATGALTAADPTQNPRLLRGDASDTCSLTNGVSALAASGNFHFDLYNFNNMTSGPVCVTVSLNAMSCTHGDVGNNQIFSGAYVTSFDPASITTNGVADSGSSPTDSHPTTSYSFVAPPGPFAVNVHEVTAGALCPAYGITLDSLQPFATTLPTVSGAPVVGGTLSAQHGTFNAATALTDQWRRCDASGGACVDIAGATTTTYVLTSADVGATLRFRNTATDAAQMSSADSTQSAVITDITPPETTITKGPKSKLKTKKKKVEAEFEFSANETGSTFQCRLDDNPLAPCSSPTTVKAKVGKHTFEVVATDVAGNADSTPATSKFKVKRKKISPA